MALPVGLVPVLVFVLTAGMATGVTVVTHLLSRRRSLGTDAALRQAVGLFAAAYLLGTAVVWWVAGGLGLWEIPATLVAAGVLGMLVFGALPLAVGRRIIRRGSHENSETALRFAIYGWPVAMVVVFGLFVAPGGLAEGNPLSLGGPRVCLVGFCGVGVPLLAAVSASLLVAVVGPGLVGLAVREVVSE